MYNGKQIETSSDEMKAFLSTLMFLQLSQIICYTILHRHIECHDLSMFQSSVISRETFQKRTNVHAMTMMSQHICFFMEFLYLAILAIFRFVGSRYLEVDDLDLFVGTFKTLEFGLLPALQVFLSSELKKELIYLVFRQ